MLEASLTEGQRGGTSSQPSREFTRHRSDYRDRDTGRDGDFTRHRSDYRERQRDRDWDRDRDRDRDWDRDRDRDRDIDGESYRYGAGERDRRRRHGDRDRDSRRNDSDRRADHHWHRDREMERDRERSRRKATARRWNATSNGMQEDKRPKKSEKDNGVRDDSVGHYKGAGGDIIVGTSDSYEVVKEVGVGTFGRVLECWHSKTKERVAIKVVRRIRKYTESAAIEADILQDVNKASQASGTSLCVKLFDSFEFEGHFCLVFEPLGSSLYELLKKNDYSPFPFDFVRSFSKQLLEAVAFLHGLRLIHTDLKPENVLVCYNDFKKVENEKGQVVTVPSSAQIKVIDFGGATYDHEHKSSIVNTRQYRAPEVILDLGWSMPSDLWSVGCIAAELFEGELLFSTHSNTEHLALMERCLGSFPTSIIERSKLRKRYFDSYGRTRVDCLSRDGQRHVRKMTRVEDFASDQPNFGFLLEGLLRIDPEARMSAEDALRVDLFLLREEHGKQC